MVQNGNIDGIKVGGNVNGIQNKDKHHTRKHTRTDSSSFGFRTTPTGKCKRKIMMNKCNIDCSGPTPLPTCSNQGRIFSSADLISFIKDRPIILDGIQIFSTSWTLGEGEAGTKCSVKCPNENIEMTSICTKTGNTYQWSTPAEILSKCG